MRLPNQCRPVKRRPRGLLRGSALASGAGVGGLLNRRFASARGFRSRLSGLDGSGTNQQVRRPQPGLGLVGGDQSGDPPSPTLAPDASDAPLAASTIALILNGNWCRN